MNSLEKKESYIVERATSVKHALRGIWLFVRVTPNFWVHFCTCVVLVTLGFFFKISTLEWAVLVGANAVVVVAEAINSAIEIDMDLTNPGVHPMVRDTKDIAAGAVLFAGVAAWVIDLLIFVPYF
jgi:diacylglycerol kinase (ATP)